MQYILLKNGFGIIISEERIIKAQNITFTFLDAPFNTTVVLKNKNGYFYKKLSDDTHSCQFDVKSIEGIVDVSISSIVGGKPARWKCDSVFVSHDGEETIVYAVCNSNKIIAKLFEDYKSMEKAVENLSKKVRELEKRLSDSFDDDFI